jgi:membrane protease YdiL (CAAX protease family)
MWDWADDEKIAEAFSKFTVFEKFVIIVWTIIPLFRELFYKNYFHGFENWMRKIIDATPAISYLGLDYIFDLSKLVNVLPWMAVSIFVIRFSEFKHVFSTPKMPSKLPGYWVVCSIALLFAISSAVSFYAPVYNVAKATVSEVNFVKSINITVLHQIQITLLFFYAVRAVSGKILNSLGLSDFKSLGIVVAFAISTLAFAIAHDYTWSYVALMIPMETLYLVLMMWFGNVWVPIALHFSFDAFAYFFIA